MVGKIFFAFLSTLRKRQNDEIPSCGTLSCEYFVFYSQNPDKCVVALALRRTCEGLDFGTRR